MDPKITNQTINKKIANKQNCIKLDYQSSYSLNCNDNNQVNSQDEYSMCSDSQFYNYKNHVYEMPSHTD